jgi:hypothetical protein
MSDITMQRCDHCKKVAENCRATRGWIHFNKRVSIGRATGHYDKTAYESDYLQEVEDFCSIACLVGALDQKAREREDAKENS